MLRPEFKWELRSRRLALGERTVVMGVLNVTPDSFSDAGRHFSRPKAVAHALAMVKDGADIIDIGGESTRPGSKAGTAGVAAKEELRRVLPVIEELRRRNPKILISIDTYKAEVARAAVEAGAEIVNDVSAGRWDPAMLSTVAELKCGLVLMHMRGRPEEWRKLPRMGADELLTLVAGELAERAEEAIGHKVGRERIVLDPGFGFGKNFEENYPLLARFHELHKLGFPLLAGTSRKSFVGRLMARDGKDAAVEQRSNGTLATVVASILQGAHIVRVHDVKPAVEAARVADVVLSEQTSKEFF
jgi:dihydropteroate synthase